MSTPISITDPTLRDAVQRYIYPRVASGNRTPCFMRATCREWYDYIEIPEVRMSVFEAERMHYDDVCADWNRRRIRYARRVVWCIVTGGFVFVTKWCGRKPPPVYESALMGPRVTRDQHDLVVENTANGRPFLLLMKMLEPGNGGDLITHLSINGDSPLMYELLWHYGKAKLFADRLKHARRLETLVIGPSTKHYISTAAVEEDIVMDAIASLPNLKRLSLYTALLPESHASDPITVSAMYASLGNWVGKRATRLEVFSFWTVAQEDFSDVVSTIMGLWSGLDPARAIRINMGLMNEDRSRFIAVGVEGARELATIGTAGVLTALQATLERLPKLQIGIFFHNRGEPRQFRCPLEGKIGDRLRFQEVTAVDFFRQEYMDDVWDKPNV